MATLENDLKANEKIKKSTPVIRDKVITITSGLSFKDIRTSSGKQALRENLTKQLQELMGPNLIRNIYITELVVQ